MGDASCSSTGTLVTKVLALDNDDPGESNNARVVYSLQKNVIDEETGRPIFAIDGRTGRIETALCCLDRERTEAYAIQVVATDGGGLKGNNRFGFLRFFLFRFFCVFIISCFCVFFLFSVFFAFFSCFFLVFFAFFCFLFCVLCVLFLFFAFFSHFLRSFCISCVLFAFFSNFYFVFWIFVYLLVIFRLFSLPFLVRVRSSRILRPRRHRHRPGEHLGPKRRPTQVLEARMAPGSEGGGASKSNPRHP